MNTTEEEGSTGGRIVAEVAREQQIDKMTGDEIAIRPGQAGFNPMQLAALRQLGVEDATEGDLQLFFHTCRQMNLDPFRKQIYMIGRRTQIPVREVSPDTGNERIVQRYVTRYTIQVGIKGFRKRAREIADLRGDRLGFEGPFWAGEDGEWRELWAEGTTPVAAKFVVFRNGEPIPFVAHYSEYVQTTSKDGSHVPNAMWSKMPRNQLAKCAEAGALDRAYPDEFSGVVLEDAAQPTIIDDAGEVQQPAAKRRGGKGVAAIAGMGEADDDAAAAAFRDANRQNFPAEPEPAVATFTAHAPNLTDQQRKKLLEGYIGLMARGGLDRPEDRENRLIVTASIIGRDLGSSNDLTGDELEQVYSRLFNLNREGKLTTFVRDTLNEYTLREQQHEDDAEQSAGGDEGRETH